MGSTQLVDFTPTDIDMIFAVSQQNLNEGLYDYISGLGAKIDWSFDVDAAGNLKSPTNPSEPDILFSGVLAPPVEPGPGNTPVWIVDLSQAGAANQVTFNVTFADGATFTDNQLKRTYTQSVATGGPQWIIPFQVNLTMAGIKDVSNEPAWLQERLAALNGNYGEVFDLSQLLLDLTTLASTAEPKASLPDGIMYYDWTLIVQGTFTYLQAHHGDIYTKSPTAGYSVTYNGGTPIQQPPTFTPTSADFVILPNSTNPGASTLVYIFMIQGREFPTSPANAFVDVTLITDPVTTPGVAVIGAPNLVSFIQEDIQSIGLQNKVVTNYVQCCKASGDVSWQLAQTDEPASITTQLPTSGNGNKFVNFKMAQQVSRDDYQPFGGLNYSNSSTTDNVASASFDSFQTDIGYTSITIGGTLSWTVGYSSTSTSTSGSNTNAWDSPNFSWSWNVSYAIQPVNATSAQTGGGVQFVQSHSDYPSTPTNNGGGGSAWLSTEPSTQELVTYILKPVITQLPSQFQTEVGKLPDIGSFVFPGGGVFSFQNPAVNNAFALYTTIQYQNPN